MSAPATGHGWTPHGPTLSIPFLLVSAILIGAGIFLLLLWFMTAGWAYFGLGLAGTVGGGLLLFHRATGAASA